MDAGTKAGDQVQVMSNQLSLGSVAGPSLATGPSTSLGQQLLDLIRHIAKLEAILKGQVELIRKAQEKGHSEMVQLMQELVQGVRKPKYRS